MSFEPTAGRIWKRLSPQERLAAASAFFREPPADAFAAAVAAIAKARKMRPQAARSLPPDAQARALASILDPGETVAASLLVALHVSDRRPMLAAFLDAAGLAHENGILTDDGAAAAPLTEEAARNAVDRLGAFAPGEVRTYLNTLWLQDPERWAVLEKIEL